MPAPYNLIAMPPGDFKNIFDFQAMHMAAAHNSFIQGLNAVVAHAPHVSEDKLKAFVFFCIILIGNINHHHHLEETFLFAEYEKKLGVGAMSGNQSEHEGFIHNIEDLEKWLKDVHADKVKYDAETFLAKVDSFADLMITHMTHELDTLESQRMRQHFTEQELRDLDDRTMKFIMKSVDFYTALPMGMVCVNPDFPAFPPFPTPLKWAVRWWFSRRHSASWEFGAVDFYGNPRPLPPIARRNVA